MWGGGGECGEGGEGGSICGNDYTHDIPCEDDNSMNSVRISTRHKETLGKITPSRSNVAISLRGVCLHSPFQEPSSHYRMTLSM